MIQGTMPKLVVLTTSYPSNEADPLSAFIARLLVALGKKGYQATVVAPSDGTFFGRRAIFGIDTIRFGYFWPRSLLRLTRGAGGIPETLNQSRLARLQLVPMMAVFLLVSLRYAGGCDVIYANWLGAGLIGALVSLITGKPLVVSFRGDDGYLARDRRLWRVLTRSVSARASAIAPVSEEIGAILVDLGIPPDKVYLPRFGVDTEMFHPADHNGQRTCSRLLFVGSLIPKKGVQDLLAALAHSSLSQVSLDVVGDGFHRSELESISKRLGLVNRVQWLGMRPPDEVAALMRQADILCLPSYTEGKPNVVREAMASGLPVVASRVGGIPEMVKERSTALLYEPGNVEDLRKCVSELVNNDELRRSMGAAARQLIVDSGVTWESTAEDFDRIFRGILKLG
ncbi:MAG: glycosyltransferase family 4 protein [Deltaproteobacteria bacterium]|nr:glycosyltransferase family 4 protein [Deltaproteobacteria bacterium]